MAADVSYFFKAMNGGDSNDSGKSTAPITRDLLGGCSTLESKELDLDLQVPCGWEKRLDLKSGKVYLQRSSSSSNTSSSESKSKSKPQNMSTTTSKSEDLNMSEQTLNLFDNASLDLKLVSPSSPPIYQSVCTLDKVKLALERAGKESARKRPSVSKSSCSPRSTSSSSVMDIGGDLDREEKSTASIATGCPRCLLYVMISRGDPKCPRCNIDVPLPEEVAVADKKRRIDLNISI